MITYNDLYEILRKEKYSETLQPLQQNFIQEFSEYINDKTASQKPNDPFSQDAKSKKQLDITGKFCGIEQNLMASREDALMFQGLKENLAFH